MDEIGGLEAVKAPAKPARAGKSAEEIKNQVLSVDKEEEEPKVYDIPDYLKPIPEDTTRKGMSWKELCMSLSGNSLRSLEVSHSTV